MGEGGRGEGCSGDFCQTPKSLSPPHWHQAAVSALNLKDIFYRAVPPYRHLQNRTPVSYQLYVQPSDRHLSSNGLVTLETCQHVEDTSLRQKYCFPTALFKGLQTGPLCGCIWETYIVYSQAWSGKLKILILKKKESKSEGNESTRSFRDSKLHCRVELSKGQLSCERIFINVTVWDNDTY